MTHTPDLTIALKSGAKRDWLAVLCINISVSDEDVIQICGKR